MVYNRELSGAQMYPPVLRREFQCSISISTVSGGLVQTRGLVKFQTCRWARSFNTMFGLSTFLDLILPALQELCT